MADVRLRRGGNAGGLPVRQGQAAAKALGHGRVRLSGLCPVCRPTAGHLHGISDPAHYQRPNGMAALYLRLPGEYQPRRLHGSDHGVVRPRAAGEAGAGKAAIRHDGGRRWGLKPAIRR